MGVPSRWASLLLFTGLAAPAGFGAVFTVDTTDDTDHGYPAATCPSPCTLRDALNAANSNPGNDTIAFGIAGCAGVCTIQPTTELPPLTDQAGVILDGYTQPGSSPNSITVGDDAVLLIEIDGSLTSGSTEGLLIQSSNNLVRGLAINSFPHNGILISTGSQNVIAGNFLGTNPQGSAAKANFSGVVLGNAAPGTPEPFANQVGGPQPPDRNLISGNQHGAINIAWGANTTTIQGNYLGTDATGNQAIANDTGVSLDSGAWGNVIGGPSSGAGNIISGNTSYGVSLSFYSAENTIVGNRIGTNAAGSAALPNFDGVYVFACSGNAIGGSNPGEGNLISGNHFIGVWIWGSSNNSLAGNFIGTDVSGSTAIPNGGDGVLVFENSTGNIIGGSSAGAGNLISGNIADGVEITYPGADGNIVQGNFIGLDSTGRLPLGNFQGIHLGNGAQNLIGGAVAGAGNVVSGNRNHGVSISYSTQTLVQGNLIGTDLTGTSAVPNGTWGIVVISPAQGTQIGGLPLSNLRTGNLISGNREGGVLFFGGGNGLEDSALIGNAIGCDITSGKPIPNGNAGVLLIYQAAGVRIGGTAAGSGNVVAFNRAAGIQIGANPTDILTTHDSIVGNLIYDNGGVGIGLGGNVVTPNDLGDHDTGPNDSQNFPVLFSAIVTGGGTGVTGALNSRPASTFAIDIYSNDHRGYCPAFTSACYGEGQTYLGRTWVTTDFSGNGSFLFHTSQNLFGKFLSSTATNAAGSTSEFSADLVVSRP